MSMALSCLLLSLLVLLSALVGPALASSPYDFANELRNAGRRHGSEGAAPSRPPPTDYTGIHDPSGVVWEESSQAWYVFGPGITSHVSTDGYESRA